MSLHNRENMCLIMLIYNEIQHRSLAKNTLHTQNIKTLKNITTLILHSLLFMFNMHYEAI